MSIGDPHAREIVMSIGYPHNPHMPGEIAASAGSPDPLPALLRTILPIGAGIAQAQCRVEGPPVPLGSRLINDPVRSRLQFPRDVSQLTASMSADSAARGAHWPGGMRSNMPELTTEIRGKAH
jgi:hypothetical protein